MLEQKVGNLIECAHCGRLVVRVAGRKFELEGRVFTSRVHLDVLDGQTRLIG
jgi:hypothetical protein